MNMPASVAADTDDGFETPTRPTSGIAGRFTLDGSDALEQHLANICRKVLAGIDGIIPKKMLEGLVLGGGYGRGEGGVLNTPQGDKPYNDLEFYIFVRGYPWLCERRYAKAMHELSETLSPVAGVEVEFKITSSAKLRHSPQSLFYYDLLLGHLWLRGDDHLLLGCEHHRTAETIPLSEATRLLMNRCSGLLFAREKLEHENLYPENIDFIIRNIAKTELALGDAVLIAFGKYHWSCRERSRRLDLLPPEGDLPWLKEVRQHHMAGVEFKLHPRLSSFSRDELWTHFREVSSLAAQVWLWLEKRRLGCDFQSITDYATKSDNKWPDTDRWRNLLANIKVFGPRSLGSRHWRHPRERILRALAFLLWAEPGASHDSIRQIRSDLLHPEPTAMVSAYQKRWKQAC